MDMRLHANATTTPRTRACIQASTAPVAQLARELGISQTTIRRWRKRDTRRDRSRTRHRLNASTTAEQEAIIVTLRTDARLSLDDITEVMQRCLSPKLSRSAIRRCLVRHHIGGPLPRDAPPEPGGRFDPAPFGYVHVDLKYLGKLRSVPEYAFVAIERVTRFAHVEILPDRVAATVAAAMTRFLAAFGHPVHTVLTDNGAESTDRFKDGSRAGHAARPSGTHPFDKACARAGTVHRTTRPYRPETNGIAERFNRRLSEAMHALPPLRDNSRHRTRFASHAEREAFLLRFVADYNRTRLRCLGYRAPLDILHNHTKDNRRAGRCPGRGPGGTAEAARQKPCVV